MRTIARAVLIIVFVLLGYASAFADPLSDAMYGLDSPVASMRAESAKAITELGNATHIPLLLSKADKELDGFAREALYRAYVNLSLKFVANKDAFVKTFLDRCVRVNGFGTQGIPLDALAAVANVKTGLTRDYFNAAVISLLAQKNEYVYPLKEIMARKGILRAENSNPGFEAGIMNWTASNVNLSNVTISQLSGDSQNVTLRIVSPAGYASAGNRAVQYSGVLPRHLEMGYLYCLEQPVSGYMVTKKTGISVVDNAGTVVVASSVPRVLLRAYIWVNSGVAASNSTGNNTTMVVKDFYNNVTGNTRWLQRMETYDAPGPITSVQLRVYANSTLPLRIDDVYVRRTEQDFKPPIPVITSVSASPQVVALPEGLNPQTEYVQLSASTDQVKGFWESNLQGKLGSNGITIASAFTLDGLHQLVFTALGNLGSQVTSKPVPVRVVKPQITLACTSLPSLSRVTSGNIPFTITVGGVDPFRSSFTTTVYLLVNGVAVSSKVLAPSESNIVTMIADASKFPAGNVRVQAKVMLSNIRSATAVFTEHRSSFIYFYKN